MPASTASANLSCAVPLENHAPAALQISQTASRPTASSATSAREIGQRRYAVLGAGTGCEMPPHPAQQRAQCAFRGHRRRRRPELRRRRRPRPPTLRSLVDRGLCRAPQAAGPAPGTRQRPCRHAGAGARTCWAPVWEESRPTWALRRCRALFGLCLFGSGVAPGPPSAFIFSTTDLLIASTSMSNCSWVMPAGGAGGG